MTTQVNTPRDELLEAIEAYADSKTVDNKTLQRLATANLAGVLKRIDIVAPAPPQPPVVVDAVAQALEEKKDTKRKTKTARSKSQ